MADSLKTISSSFLRFFSGTLLSRATGVAREVVMAAAFGTLPIVASFWMAFRFAHLLRRLFGEGALHVAFVPHFEHLRKQESEGQESAAKAARFFSDLSSYLLKLLIVLTIAIEAILGSVLLFGNVTASTSEIIVLTMLMLPSLIFICLHALNSSLLHCEKSFFLPSVSPVILNVVWIATVGLMWGKPSQHTMIILAIVVVFGFAFQWLSTLIPARIFLKNSPPFQKEKNNPRALVGLVRPFLLSMLGVAATQINNGLDAIFARAADLEGPAYLWYALRIEQLPLGLLGVSLSSALLPPIARAIEEGDLSRYVHFLELGLMRAVAFMIPITGGIFALGFVSVNLLYGRGAFDAQSITQTTYCLWAYGMGLAPMTLVLILAAAFYATKEYRIPTFICLSAVALNVALNALFVYFFHLSAISIAIATSVAATFNALGLLYFLIKKNGFSLSKMSAPTIKIALSTGAAVVCTLLLSSMLLQDNTLNALLHLPLEPFTSSLPTQLLAFSVEAALYGSFILFFAYLFKAQEIFSLLPSRLKALFIK